MANSGNRKKPAHLRCTGGARPRHGAARPYCFTLAEYRAILGRVVRSLTHEDLAMIAAGVSFYAMLALVPTLVALMSIYGFVADPSDAHSLLALLRPIVPDVMYELIDKQITSLVHASGTAFKWTSLGTVLLALWSAKHGVNALLSGLNLANRERDDRSFVKAWILSYGLTLLLIVLMAITLGAIVVIPAAFAFVPDPNWQARLVLWLRWPVAIAAVVISIGVLYRLGPSRRGAAVPWLSPGALLATGLWMLASFALSYYLRTFGTYQAAYGALGAVIALMLWLWLGSLIVLLGARLNAEMEYQTDVDTTRGPPRPMGQRGAFVADHVVTEEDGGDR